MPVLTARQTSTDERIGAGGVITVLIAAALLVLALWSGLLSPPAHVERVTLQNPYDWTASVEARQVGTDGWTPIGTVGPRMTRQYTQVLDHGADWDLRFHVPGGPDVTIAVSRRQLTHDGWTVVVPSSLVSAARAAQVPRSTAEPTSASG